MGKVADPGPTLTYSAAAKLAQQALNDYLRLLNLAEIQLEIEQTQKLLASWRNSLPHECEDDDRGFG
jgi:hypothetical protein